MNAELARLMDELGLKILIDDFVGRVHYHPDLKDLPRFVDPRRMDPRFVHPRAEAVELRLSPPERHPHYALQRFAFPSPAQTPFHPDQTVCGTVFSPTDRPPGEPPARGTVVLVHGGFLGAQPRGADLRPYLRLAIELTQQGLRVVLPALPRHLERAPEGTFSGERFLSGNLLETIDVIVQAVWELECLVDWLAREGLGPVGLLGMSLGGLSSLQLLALTDSIQAAILLAPVPDAPRSLFESPIGRTIRLDWQAGGATRSDLEAVFASLSPTHRRPLQHPTRLRLVCGRYDAVVLPRDVERMGETWGVEVWQEEEGHLGLIGSAALRRRIVAFFAGQLGPEGAPAPGAF